MIKRIVGWFVLVPLSAVLVVFALANRQLVVVNFNPFVPAEALSTLGYGIPLFLVLFAVLLIGILLGGVAAWFAQGDSRRDKRHWRREAELLARENEALRRAQTQAGGRRVIEVDDLANNR